MCMVFKVDFEKSYDFVNWEFLFNMLRRLGFCDKWIIWIKRGMESTSVSFLVNGNIVKAMLSKIILMMPKTQVKNQESSKFQESRSRFKFQESRSRFKNNQDQDSRFK